MGLVFGGSVGGGHERQSRIQYIRASRGRGGDPRALAPRPGRSGGGCRGQARAAPLGGERGTGRGASGEGWQHGAQALHAVLAAARLSGPGEGVLAGQPGVAGRPRCLPTQGPVPSGWRNAVEEHAPPPGGARAAGPRGVFLWLLGLTVRGAAGRRGRRAGDSGPSLAHASICGRGRDLRGCRGGAWKDTGGAGTRWRGVRTARGRGGLQHLLAGSTRERHTGLRGGRALVSPSVRTESGRLRAAAVLPWNSAIRPSDLARLGLQLGAVAWRGSRGVREDGRGEEIAVAPACGPGCTVGAPGDLLQCGSFIPGSRG